MVAVMTQPPVAAYHVVPPGLPRFCEYVPMDKWPTFDGDADVDAERDEDPDVEPVTDVDAERLADGLAVFVCVAP